MDDATAVTRRLLDRVHREEYPRIVASTARLTGDLGMAEDAVQDAVGAAIANWSRTGPPDNPGAWLTTVARNRAIDAMRREGRRIELEASSAPPPAPPDATGPVVDDQLRLMFVTCHPALTADTRVALTLKFVCGLRTHEIARVLLVGEEAVTKRIQRGRRKIRDARIPMQVPPRERLGERVRWVLDCLYLVFTEGYAATDGDQLVRSELCAEAIRLTRLVAALDPADPAPMSLLALELLQDARRTTRLDGAGRPVLLADQDREQWDRGRIAEALALIERAQQVPMPSASARSHLLQARIAAEHAIAPTWEQTDWTRICAAYDELHHLTGSPVVGMNRVVAVSMVAGPGPALALLDSIDADDRVVASHHWQLVRADLLERLGDADGAAAALHTALLGRMSAPERDFILDRLEQLSDPA
jgi:RNA polymerase sigma-70 factor (ECF subfamily)